MAPKFLRDSTGNLTRRAMQAVFTPAGERALRLVGHKRALKIAAVVAFVLTVITVVVAMVIISVMGAVARPVLVVANVVGSVADLFGSTDDSDAEVSPSGLAAMASTEPLTCRAQPPVTKIAPAATPTSVPARASGSPSPSTTSASAGGVRPIIVGVNGAVERADAKKLIDPVPPKTSALTAEVWFLYRLAGIGEWSAFTAAYRQAGFTGKEEGASVATSQAVRLAAGTDLSPYELTASALALSGLLAGRYSEPNDSYRGAAMAAVMEHCDDTGASSSSSAANSAGRTTTGLTTTTAARPGR